MGRLVHTSLGSSYLNHNPWFVRLFVVLGLISLGFEFTENKATSTLHHVRVTHSIPRYL